MLEKARIHRAMLHRDPTGGFAVSDLAADTGAAAPTIRQTIARAASDDLLAPCGKRPVPGRGGPERLYRLTDRGRSRLAVESARIYDALLTTPDNGADLALAAAQESIGALAARERPLRRRTVAVRLATAAAELAEAARGSGATRRIAAALAHVVGQAVAALEGIGDDDPDALRLLCDDLLAQAADAAGPSMLDTLPGLLDQLRLDAASAPAARAEEMVSRALAETLAAYAASPDGVNLAAFARGRLRQFLKDGAAQADSALQGIKNSLHVLAAETSLTNKNISEVRRLLEEMANHPEEMAVPAAVVAPPKQVFFRQGETNFFGTAPITPAAAARALRSLN